MANRVPPTPRYADNSSGSLPAACSVWRCGDADSMSARTVNESTPDAGYTTAGALPTGPQSVRLLLLRGSPYRWVRSDKLASAEANEEILRLHKLLEKKDEEISRYGVTQSLTTKGLAQGADLVELTYSVYLTDPTLAYNTQRTSRHTAEITLTWDEIYKSFAPHLLTPVKLSTIKSGINSLVREKELEHIQTLFPELNIGTFSISNMGLQMVIVQFTALAYLEIFNIEDIDRKPYKIAGLTPQGRSYLLNASAIKRGEIARANFAPHDSDAPIDD